jgi:hypothetical protein
VSVSWTGTTPTSSDAFINGNRSHFIGQVASAQYFNGYITEINFIGGSALDQNSFGQLNANTGVWEPKSYTGSYSGTNSFYLKFADNSGTTSTTLGKDSSGNGNNWTPNLFSVTAGAGNDSLVDSPTAYGTDTGVGGEVRGNYCTWNPLVPGWSASLSTYPEANLSIYGNNTQRAIGTQQFPTTGKWYFEIQNISYGTGGSAAIGVTTSPSDPTVTTAALYQTDGTRYLNGSSTAYGATWGSPSSNTDVIGIAVNNDAGTITFYKNNTSQGAITHNLGNILYPVVGKFGANAGYITVNFGQRAFAYTAPSGFKALCTTNLPTPTIGATSTTQANKYFDTTIYTGNGAVRSITNSGSMQPDFVWDKLRSGANSHRLFDAVRGVEKALYSNLTNIETTETGTLTSFNSDGFSLGTNSETNTNTSTYVAWQWKANGAGSTNSNGTAKSSSVTVDSGTDTVTWNSHGMSDGQKIGFFAATMPGGLSAGTLYYVRDAATNTFKVAASSGGAAIDITSNGTTVTAHTTLTSTVSANTTAGFSIVKHINSGAPATIEHGLGVAPKFIINKVYDRTENWRVYYGISNKLMQLNTTSAEATDTNVWNNTNPTSNVFSIGTYWSSGDDVISYCFAEVPGYSAFGSYTGNGSTDGVFIYLGFRPRYVLIKRTNTTENWHVMDTSRNPYNYMDLSLYPNLSNAEVATSGHAIDFVSNGIKMRNSNTGYNASGSTYIYAAFAESPFKYSLAR